jgi:SAM-dependent methyltransferase
VTAPTPCAPAAIGFRRARPGPAGRLPPSRWCAAAAAASCTSTRVPRPPRSAASTPTTTTPRAEPAAPCSVSKTPGGDASSARSPAGWPSLRPDRGRLLDVGCGSGELLEALRDDGWRVSGVEPSARSAEIARTQRGLDVQTAAFDDAALPESSCDVVVLAAVLEHLHDPLAALIRARRLLTPGGLVAVLFLPRFDAPQARLFGPRWIGLDLPRHLYQFETRTFAAAAEAAGLRVIATEPYSRRHSPAFWTASLFPGLQKQRLNLTARRAPGRAAAGKAAFAALTAAARPLARAEAALGFEPQRSYFLVAAAGPRDADTTTS